MGEIFDNGTVSAKNVVVVAVVVKEWEVQISTNSFTKSNNIKKWTKYDFNSGHYIHFVELIHCTICTWQKSCHNHCEDKFIFYL